VQNADARAGNGSSETESGKMNTELNVLPWRQDGGNNVGIVKAVLRCIVSSQMVSWWRGSAKNIIQYAGSITRSIR